MSPAKQITVVIDAMGGDYAPLEIVKGGVLAARNLGIKVILTGKKEQIEKILHDEKACNLNIEVIDAPDDIPMDEKNPARAVRRAPNSSVVLANQLVKDGKADAVVAAGNTGAATAASLFTLGRIKGFERPCICTIIPTVRSKMLLIDGGSNIESTAEQIVQSAILGSLFAKIVFKIDKPRIGLLNIGEEPGKGTELYKTTYDLLKAESKINFVGNVEGKTIIDGSLCDAAICDGFTGNIHLKALEGGLKMMSSAVQEEIKAGGPLALLAGLILKNSGVFTRLKNHFHPNSYGGALLGGINGVSIISHGSSNSEAILNACKHAALFVEEDLIKKLSDAV